MNELKSINKLIEAFKLFPTVGEKSAERMAYAVLNLSNDQVESFVEALKEVKINIHSCPICGMLTEDEICDICRNDTRDHTTCLVVSNQKDILPFEKSKTFKGIYHCLNGDINPMKGITPKDLRIDELFSRIDEENIKEIIIATNPTLEGETTALYLAKVLAEANKDIKITRLAYGIPFGGQLDYTDELTIERALKGRTDIK